ncbi:protein tramtrack, beta isoform-like isoform X1 [Homarus americanus]|uniref:protein tramtrack, beta isoform-like isoform X1 n=2 Tax=Homarus americanus TaxID=6706 RepID=UPI001C486E85|nr:protein tramtrack, beta isoform-like isoform X1 [Homarus americanus]
MVVDTSSINSTSSEALLMMGSDQYCLKWNNHWANLIRVFNSLLQSETFVDVTLACEGRHLKAHRLVLSACSPYFKELLVAHPDKHPIVILKDVRYSELRTLIEFIYNGEVSVEQHDLAALLCTARELQIKGLADNRLPGASSPPHPHCRVSGEATSHTLTTTTTASSTNTTDSTAPPHEANTVKSSSPRRKIGSEDRPPPPLHAIHPGLSIPVSSHLPTYRSRPTSRESSPVHKRRRVSTGGSDNESNVCEGSSKHLRSEAPNGHLSSHQEHNDRQYTAVAGPSGLRVPDPNRREDSNSRDSNWDADKSSPSITKVSGGQTSNPGDTKTSLHSEDDTDDDRGPMTIQSPEVILEEGEVGVGSTGPPSSVPSPSLTGSGLGNTSITPAGLGGPLAPSGPLPPVALLHQALALGYHPLQHYFPSNLLEQQQQSQQHPGVSPPKELMHFLDVMKALPPSARLPLPLGGPAGVGGTSGLALGLPGVSGTTATSTASLSVARDKNVGGGITCHICAMILPSSHHLEEHVRIHEEEKPYKCDQCGQRYKYQSAFQRHQEQNHTAKLPGDKPFRCGVCGQCFKYHKSFTKHRSNHDALDRIMKAEAEEGRLGSRGIHESYLQRLLVNESSKSESEASITLKEEGLETQQQEEGAERRPSTSNPTTFNAALLQTVNPENGVKKYEDGEDDEEGEVEGEEEEGEYEEENKGKFVYCVKCKSTFRDVANFEGHCRGSTDCSLDTLREVNVNDGPGLSCPPSIASSPQASPRLSPSSVSGPPRSPLPASTPMAMPSPPATTTPIGGLPPSSSVAVSTATASTTTVTPGTSTPPGHNSLFKLDSRGALMLSQAPLPPASDSRGDEERPFKCQFCQKGFKGRENLKLHIRTHTGEKPYNCGVCGKAFGGRSDMNRHLRIHTGEKPYPCKVCGKKFARADYLSKHITTHLGVPFAKPVHSLQQSLQNLENMQNLQNLHKLQNMSNE